MATVCAHIIVSGKVQGVYYRATAQEQAIALHLTGWVRNRPDGKVEGIIEGVSEDVHKMIAWCRQGPSGAVVEDLQVDWQDPKSDFSTFTIAPTGE